LLDYFAWFVGNSQLFAIKMCDCEVDTGQSLEQAYFLLYQ